MKRFAHQLKVEILQSVIYPLRRKQSEHDMALPCSASFHASDFFSTKTTKWNEILNFKWWEARLIARGERRAASGERVKKAQTLHWPGGRLRSSGRGGKKRCETAKIDERSDSSVGLGNGKGGIHLSPPQTTARLDSLANCFFFPPSSNFFFSPFPLTTEPGLKLKINGLKPVEIKTCYDLWYRLLFAWLYTNTSLVNFRH